MGTKSQMDLPEIVVGIDFGTTYSGVSWAVNAGDKIVRLIKDWVNPTAINHKNTESDKVPTLVSYDEDSGEVKWGFEADMKQSKRWFKILLDPEHDHARRLSDRADDFDELSCTTGDAMGFATDYLRHIWEYTQEHITREQGDDWMIKHPVTVVLSVPAMWSQSAKERTKDIAKLAGLPDDIYLVSEPEAAALAVIKDRQAFGDRFKKDDVFMVCDAGGGTVDLISYRILDTNPIQVEECVKGTGDICGAALIDLAFEGYVKAKVGKEYSTISEDSWNTMIYDFDYLVKRPFRGPSRTDSVRLEGVSDNPSEGIHNQRVEMSGFSIQTMFDHVCNQVMDLVKGQIDEVSETGRKIKKIFLVGGFGANFYLYDRLRKDWEVGKAGIGVIQSDKSWSSICRGATLWGIEHSERRMMRGEPTTVRSRIARYSYGVKIDERYDWDKHWEQEIEVDAAGRKIAKGRMFWLIKGGDRIEEGKCVEKETTQCIAVNLFHLITFAKQPFAHTLWCSQDQPPPKRYNSEAVKELCTVEHSVRKGGLIRRGKGQRGEARDVKFTLAIKMGSASLDFVVVYNSAEVARHCQGLQEVRQ